jgi:hypothetical protein
MGLATVILLGVAATGCAQEDPEKAEAQEEMCAANDRLKEALRNFTQTDRENRSEQMAAARDELFDAIADVAHASGDVAEAEGADSSNPVTQLNQDLQDIEDDATVTEVAQGMATSAGSFLEGVKEFIQGREC